MVIELVQDLGPWTWMIVGVALLALEIAAPGAFFLWFGLAAIAVGVLSLFVAVPWQAQLLIFVGLNQRGQRLVGTIVVLSEPIVDGKGRVRIDDTTWRVIGPNMVSGTRVRVVHADGALLTVRADNGG